jgi:uncharacterized membrane protein
MALGALIGAYQEDDSGGLRALLPLAGRTLLEYQVRCAASAGASPVVVIVERVPQALQDAFERLRLDGVSVVPVSDVHEAVSRFEAGAMLLLVGDGAVVPAELVAALAEEAEPAIATVPDTERYQDFERIDAQARWAGVAVVSGRTLGSTAAMLGDWDLQSTLLRRAIQDGAVRVPVNPDASEPLIAERADQLEAFQRGLIAGSRQARTDWASRYVLPPIEEFATEQLMESNLRPGWLLWGALALTLGGAFAFSRGWLVVGLVLLVLSTPLDIIASRLATLRLRPLPARMVSRVLLWPAAGIALLALAYWQSRSGSGWGAVMTALAAGAFAQAARTERAGVNAPGELWLFSRRNAILAAIPFAIAGAWTGCLIALFLYSGVSFFYLQHARRLESRVDAKLTEIG